MKSKDIQNLTLRLHQEEVNGNEIYEHLRGTVSRATIYYWIKIINRCDTIDLTSPIDCSRVIRTKALIRKAKQRWSREKRTSTRILPKEMNVFHTNMRRVIKEELGLKPYIKRISPRLTEQHKIPFGFWVRKIVQKSMTEKFYFLTRNISISMAFITSRTIESMPLNVKKLIIRAASTERLNI